MSFLLIEKLSHLMVGPDWSKTGIINLKSTEFIASFVIEHSQQIIEGVMGTN